MTATRRRIAVPLTVLAIVACLAVAIATAPTANAANTKTMSGELACPGAGWVTRIWFLGERSGMHGVNVLPEQQPTTLYDKVRRPLGKYKFTAVKGELVKVWIQCSNTGEHYSEFRVGRGSTRTICAWPSLQKPEGTQACASNGWASCATKALLGSRSIKTLLCLARG